MPDLPMPDWHAREGSGSGPADLTGFVLAGGKSTRMGSDKAYLRFEGETLLSRALSTLDTVAREVRIVGSCEKFSRLALVVEDIFPERGPLGGIHAALRSSNSDLNLMLAVDMPFVSASLLHFLTEKAWAAPRAVVVVPKCDGRCQPLCAIYRREFADVAEAALMAGRNKINPLFETVPTHLIDAEELLRAGFSSAMFRNLNTPEDVAVSSGPVEQRRA